MGNEDVLLEDAQEEINLLCKAFESTIQCYLIYPEQEEQEEQADEAGTIFANAQSWASIALAQALGRSIVNNSFNYQDCLRDLEYMIRHTKKTMEECYSMKMKGLVNESKNNKEVS